MLSLEIKDMNNKIEYTPVGVLLDNSGSMSIMGKERIQSLHKLYEDQKIAGPFKSTLAIFSNKMKYIHKDVIGTEIGEIEDFTPDGMTALYDSIIEITSPFIVDGIKNGILVIITDGCENSSLKNNSQSVKNQINILEKMGWKVIYIGANQDSYSVAKDIGVTMSCDYEATPVGFRNMMREVSEGLTRQISGKGEFELENNTIHNGSVTQNLDGTFSSTDNNLQPVCRS